MMALKAVRLLKFAFLLAASGFLTPALATEGSLVSVFTCAPLLRAPEYTAIQGSKSFSDVLMHARVGEIYLENPRATPGEVYAKVDASHHRGDLEKISKWTDALLADVGRETETYLKNGNTPFRQKFAEWYPQRLERFAADLKKILAQESFTLADYKVAAEIYSKMSNFNGFSYYFNASSFATSTSIEEAFEKVVDLHLVNRYFAFPLMTLVPTTRSLGFHAMNEIHGIGMKYLGLVNREMSVDGTHYEPMGFYDHDETHAGFQLHTLLNEVLGPSPEKIDDRIANLTAGDLRKCLEKQLENNTRYWRYYDVIKDYPTRERVIAESLFFLLDHEHPTELGPPSGLFDRLEAILLHSSEQVFRLDYFIERLNKEGDFAQAFKPGDLPISFETASAVLGRVVREGKARWKP